MKLKESVEIGLLKPIQYHHNGEAKEGSLVVLVPPNMKQHKYRLKLQQHFFRAMKSASGGGGDDKPSSQFEPPKGAEVMALLLVSEVDIGEVFDDFKRLACSGCARMEDEEVFTDTMYDKLQPDDVEKMCGEFLASFIIASALKNLNS